ncbi:MAG TPA: tetratricopeptide repeat protein, partial [Actinomycetota bacterium]|nr:tetratricopeptide repeat protein [Actinomycetota bacterium]
EDRDLIAARRGHLIGLTNAPAELHEMWWGVRRFLEALAQRRPVIAIFDDLHWAQPALLDLVEYLAESTRHAPILLLCLARPELLDDRPKWGGGKVNATSILLEPLSGETAGSLVENLLGTADVALGVKSRIADAADGNPLFVEEILAMFIDEGRLLREDGRWIPTTDLSDVAVPPTIQALLAARLERLPADERAVLERASVEGKVFHVGAVAELVPARIGDRVGEHLRTLVRKELIRPERESFMGQDAFSFRHILLRDEAYRGMPKETRAALHERFAAWLERSAGEWLPEYREIVGYHLEQSYRAHADLGPIGRATAETGRRAAEHLDVAGRRALDRGDVRAAANLFDRALAMLPDVDAGGVRLRIRLAEALTEMGEFARADDVLERALDESRDVGDERLTWLALMQRATLRINTDPGNSTAEARRDAQDAIRYFTQLGDDEGLARAWYVLAFVAWNEARTDATTEALEHVIRHADATGDVRLKTAALALMAAAASWGALPVDEGIRRADDVLRRGKGHSLVESVALAAQGTLAAHRGRFDDARALIARSREILAELGQTVMHAATAQDSGRVEMLAGDAVAAEREFRGGYELLERIGERAYLSTIAALLAEALHEQGRLDEALRFTQVSEEAADPRDLASQISWRMTRAKVLAGRGDHGAAERLARDAVALAAGTDILDTHGDALLSLGEVLREAGRAEEARAAFHDALELYERKGASVRADAAQAILAGLGG